MTTTASTVVSFPDDVLYRACCTPHWPLYTPLTFVHPTDLGAPYWPSSWSVCPPLCQSLYRLSGPRCWCTDDGDGHKNSYKQEHTPYSISTTALQNAEWKWENDNTISPFIDVIYLGTNVSLVRDVGSSSNMVATSWPWGTDTKVKTGLVGTPRSLLLMGSVVGSLST